MNAEGIFFKFQNFSRKSKYIVLIQWVALELEVKKGLQKFGLNPDKKWLRNIDASFLFKNTKITSAIILIYTSDQFRSLT